jgi:hypothetical protein
MILTAIVFAPVVVLWALFELLARFLGW